MINYASHFKYWVITEHKNNVHNFCLRRTLILKIWRHHTVNTTCCVLQETARVSASGSRGSPTSGSPTLRSDMFHHRTFVWHITLYRLLTVRLCFLRWLSGRRCWAPGCWPKAASRTRSSLLGYLHRTDQRYEHWCLFPSLDCYL